MDAPIRELFDFARVSLRPGGSVVVTLSLPPSVLASATDDGVEWLRPGAYSRVHRNNCHAHFTYLTVMPIRGRVKRSKSDR